jgi:ketosteroid isomerase-like protein
MEQPEVAVVRAVYGAFASADVTAILELFSPDATVYQSPSLPWGGTHEGHDGLLHFLATLSTTIASTVETERLYADGDGHVVQVGTTRGEVRTTGARYAIPETHVWTVRDGRVTCFEVYLDTAAMLAALDTAPAEQPERSR